MHQPFSYLALGDSYTIGEGAPLHQSFPYQAVRLLREAGFEFSAPEIIAKTGWTTGELEGGIAEHRFLSRYDFVSLLIGVNNQYRGLEIIEYKEQFEKLLKHAISFSGNKPGQVVILSIPNYGLTPHGEKMDVEKITRELDAFNSLGRALSIQFHTQYIDLSDPEQATQDPSLVAADGLHPSEAEYRRWAKKLAALLRRLLKK